MIERLNPILEQPPCLVLSERRRTKAEQCHVLPNGTVEEGPAQNFFVVATAGLDTPNLSPALLNRFLVVSMDDALPDRAFTSSADGVSPALAAAFRSELDGLLAGLLPGATAEDRATIRSSCDAVLRIGAQAPQALPGLTFRTFVRLLDATYKLSRAQQFAGDSLSDCFGAAFSIIITPQVSPAAHCRAFPCE